MTESAIKGRELDIDRYRVRDEPYYAEVNGEVGLFTIAAVFGISRFEVFEWTGVVSLSVGIAAFAAGTWYYLSRVEP